jgi:two-component system, NtrC family, response regulator AtoC
MMSNSQEIPRILIVSRDANLLGSLWSAADAHSWQVEVAADILEAIDRILSRAQFDLLLLDQPEHGRDSLKSLRALRRLRPTLPMILIGHPDDADRRQESIRLGARDYLMRPLEDHQLGLVLRSNLSGADDRAEISLTSDDIESVGGGKCFIGISPATKRLRAQIALLTAVDTPVFLFGELGSGKETIARLLHGLSVRSGFEFAKVNCVALPEDLLERELFGAAGATQSQRTKPKLELCHGGTVFLDAVTEMPLGLQAKLAHALLSGHMNKSESSEGQYLDVRIIAASSTSIEQAVAERRLHAGLVQLFGAHELKVPALRERKEEIPLLSRYFMHHIARHYGLQPLELTPAVAEAWQAHNWPGNLHELEQAVKRHLVTGGKALDFENKLPDAKTRWQGFAVAEFHGSSGVESLHRQLHNGISGYKSLRALLRNVKEETEKSAIASALEKTGWNRKAAARLLKTSYRTVLYKIEQYKMHCPAVCPPAAADKRDHIHPELRSDHQDGFRPSTLTG